jgi:SAM-dependent methyltransferase
VSRPPDIAGYWDAAAGEFDAEPDHGLRESGVRAAWARSLNGWLPPPPAEVLDLGCGTGSLAALAAAAGHLVTGVDLSPRMAELARAKLARLGLPAEVLVGDAADPPVGGRTFDGVLVRHLVWTLPDPHAALRRWVGLLRPGGRPVLVEGRWSGSATGEPYALGAERLPWPGGVTAAELGAAVAPLAGGYRVERLADPALWGRAVEDERYALIAER